jgi:hypothetical protein
VIREQTSTGCVLRATKTVHPLSMSKLTEHDGLELWQCHTAIGCQVALQAKQHNRSSC